MIKARQGVLYKGINTRKPSNISDLQPTTCQANIYEQRSKRSRVTTLSQTKFSRRDQFPKMWLLCSHHRHQMIARITHLQRILPSFLLPKLLKLIWRNSIKLGGHTHCSHKIPNTRLKSSMNRSNQEQLMTRLSTSETQHTYITREYGIGPPYNHLHHHPVKSHKSSIEKRSWASISASNH